MLRGGKVVLCIGEVFEKKKKKKRKKLLFFKIKKKLKITPNAFLFSTAMSDRVICLLQKAMSLFHRTIFMLSCSQAAPLPPNVGLRCGIEGGIWKELIPAALALWH